MQRESWQKLTEQGMALLRQGQPKEALLRLQWAERKAPKVREVRYWLANAYRMTGQARRALTILSELLAEEPGDYDAAFALAFLLRDAGRPGDAAKVLLAAARQPAVTKDRLLQIGGFLRDSNQFDAAIEVCEKALQLSPDEAGIHSKLGRLYQVIGAFEPALLSVRKALDLEPSSGPAWLLLARQKRFETTEDSDFQRIRAAAQQSHGRETDMCIAFAFGKALDDLGQYEPAWQQYRKGNQLKSDRTPWDPDAWRRFVERSTSAPAAAEAGPPGPARNAVFIVGMPRSGTTLLEQMLGRHAEIHVRGETNFLQLFARQIADAGSVQQAGEMADVLWSQLRLDGPEDGIYIDKNPLNFRCLDALFALVPTARVLHVTRDGRDSCLSCYFQPFEHEDTAFSNDLDHLAGFYEGYRRLMAHWEKRFADRIRRVEYEKLVDSSADVLEGVLAFLGADWDDAVLERGGRHGAVRTASAWQARQPVHSRSVGRWRHYYAQVPEFFDGLAAIDARYESR